MAHLGGLVVANLAHEDDVGILAQNVAQTEGEGEADLRLNLDLADAGHLVFDGILDGDDVLVGRVDALETGVERGGLAGTGGTGDEDDAVRASNELVDKLVVFLEHAQFFEAEQEGALLEDTHDDTLAEGHGNHRDADVDLFAAEADLDAAVLGAGGARRCSCWP